MSALGSRHMASEASSAGATEQHAQATTLRQEANTQRILATVADTRTPEQRRRIMSAVRRRDTEPEIALRRALHAAGIRGWRCDYRRAPGRPDIAWPSLRVAVFVDGAFWHGHPSRHRPGRSGSYWDDKIAANVARDRRVDTELHDLGWTVLRIWDFEIRGRIDQVVDRISLALGRNVHELDPASPGWHRQLAT